MTPPAYCSSLPVIFILFITLTYGLNLNPRTEVTEKVCHGTSNGLSKMGFHTNMHYSLMQKRYIGCTVVIGNLEITHLTSDEGLTFDLSFLATIRVVTGYVLLVSMNVDVIPLTDLVFVRGDNKFVVGGQEYVMFVALNHSPGGISLPSLKEVSGNMAVKLNEACFLDTILWDDIVKGRADISTPRTNFVCDDCSPQCADEDNIRRCWGAGENMCQKVSQLQCDWLCRNTTCYKEGLLGCCHPECVGSCSDSWIDTACQVCRHYQYNGHCVQECPRGTYYKGQDCIQDTY